MYVGDHVILHICDEATRWSQAVVLRDGRNAEEVCAALTNHWFRLFGAPTVITTDPEGALDSEYGANWVERWGTHIKHKAKNQHAQIVERHHELLRSVIRKVIAQLTEEGLELDIQCIISEAIFVKNAFIKVHGVTPYNAVLGRTPMILQEFEGATMGQLMDCLLYTSPSPRDGLLSRMPSSA